MDHVQIRIDELIPYSKQPFLVVKDESYKQLVASIRDVGILRPIIVRPAGNMYEVICGQRRITAAKELSHLTVPAFICEYDDMTALKVAVEDNINRAYWLPTDLARCAMQMLNEVNHQGRRDFISIERSNEKVAKLLGMNREKVRQYVRLNYLPESITKFVDNKKMKLAAAVELSYLSDDGISLVGEAVEACKKYPSFDQAKTLRKMDEEKSLSPMAIRAVLNEEKPKKDIIKIEVSEIEEYFPRGSTAQDMYDTIIELIKTNHDACMVR